MTDKIPFPGLMMTQPLLLKEIALRAERFFGSQEVVSYRDGRRHVRTFAETVERARRLASSLDRLGVRRGDRVATFAWNTQEHLELYLAVPAMGAVLHAVNIRIHEDEIKYIVQHAGDSVLFVDDVLIDRLPHLPGVKHQVVIGGISGQPGALSYEDLITQGDPSFEFPDIPETSAAGMCYTGGTTGQPKGVVYSHRSTVLHTILESLPDYYAFQESDVVLPIVPMFHANAWGLPYAALMVGARLVLPGDSSSPAEISKMIADEKATFAAAITTIWHGISVLPDPSDMSTLRQAVAGGAPLTEKLVRQLDGMGVAVIQGYGMTEANPLLSVGKPPADLAPGTDEWMSARLSLGRPMPFVGVKVDDVVGGELMLGGNTIASSYFDAPEQTAEKFDTEGWMRTGDIVDIDKRGLIRLVDRTKDLIKSGGEWIPSVALENAIVAHQGVAEAVVVAVADDRWGERPCAFVRLREDSELTVEDLKHFLVLHVSKWWVPERIEFVPEILKTSIGKPDKKALRRLAEIVTTEPQL